MSLTKADIARAVSEVLELPIYHGIDEGGRLVQAVLETIKEALWRGESVYIEGLGTFSVYERAAHQKRIIPIFNRKSKPVIIRVKARKRVKFTPSEPLREAMKHEHT